jgi:hypothetical protein
MRPLAVLVLSLTSSLCFTAAVQAQEHATDRGSSILGGSAGLSSQKAGMGSRSTYMHLNPSVQYFVQPGLAVGGTLSLARSSYDGASSTIYGAGPQVSYYFSNGEQALRPYLSGRTIYSGVSGGGDGVLTYGGNVGVLYLFTRSVGLDASVFYNAWSARGSGPSARADAMGLAVGFSAFAF